MGRGDGIEAVVDVDDREQEGEDGTDRDISTLRLFEVANDLVAEGEDGDQPDDGDDYRSCAGDGGVRGKAFKSKVSRNAEKDKHEAIQR